MRVQKCPWLGIVLIGLMMGIGGAARAELVTVTIDAVVTFDPTGDLAPGTPFSADLFLDDAAPNEEIPPFYLAIDPGTLSATIDGTGPFPGVVADVFTEGSTFWDARGTVDISPFGPLFDSPYWIFLEGVGMTPGQILPDFTSGLIGTIEVGVPGTGGSERVLADVTGLSIAPTVPPAVPLSQLPGALVLIAVLCGSATRLLGRSPGGRVD